MKCEKCGDFTLFKICLDCRAGIPLDVNWPNRLPNGKELHKQLDEIKAEKKFMKNKIVEMVIKVGHD